MRIQEYLQELSFLSLRTSEERTKTFGRDWTHRWSSWRSLT